MTLTPFVPGVNTSFSSQLNDNFESGLAIGGLNLIRQMQDRAVTFGAGQMDWWGEAYIDSNGRNDSINTSVDVTTAQASTLKYVYSAYHLTSTTDTSTGVATSDTSVTTTNVVCTATSNLIITDVDFECTTTGNKIFTVNIILNAVTIATKTSASAVWSSGGTISFTLSDYSTYIPAGQSFTVQTTVNVALTLMGLTNKSYSGTLFGFSGQTINGADTATMNITAQQISTNNSGLIVHTLPSNTFVNSITSAIGIPLVANWETGANIEYKLQSFSDYSGPFVVIEATSLVNTNFAINNCKCLPIATGKWVLYCTTGTNAVKRAQIYKTLFYGSTGSDPRASVTYITGLTALKTNTARDVGKRAYLVKADVGTNGVGTYTGTYANTTTNNYCSTWSNVVDVGSSTGQWEQPSGTTINSSLSEIGTDKEAAELNNPATCQIDINNVGTGTLDVAVIILCVDSITWVAAGVSKNATNLDFYTSNSIPLLTATSETITSSDSGWLTCGVTPNISKFTAFTYQPDTLVVRLSPKISTPTVGYPAIAGFVVRAE